MKILMLAEIKFAMMFQYNHAIQQRLAGKHVMSIKPIVQVLILVPIFLMFLIALHIS
jgi:hypothetical protein